jgi:hypothetical protein
MNDFDVHMINNECVLEGDADSSFDISTEEYNHLQENEAPNSDYFNLSSEWQEKIKQIESESLLCVRSLMDVDSPGEKDDSGTFGGALFAETMPLK